MKKKKWLRLTIVLIACIAAALSFLNKRGQTDIIVDNAVPILTVTSSAFYNLGTIPDKHTGRGEDVSPDLQLSDPIDSARSIAIIMDDLDVPWASNYNHWVIWNIPVVIHIPEGISHGETVPELGGAIQGTAFGRHRYRGPMPPFGTHRYQFHVFVLDMTLDLDSSCGKSDLLAAMEGHIVQYGTITGWYPRKAD